ncbi:hypothetical protein [Virgisporangium aurantiacum]|nr:hypothetical protein [Virgisporangium aurantiacum]
MTIDHAWTSGAVDYVMRQPVPDRRPDPDAKIVSGVNALVVVESVCTMRR